MSLFAQRLLTKLLTSVTVHQTKRGQDAAWLRQWLLTKLLRSVIIRQTKLRRSVASLRQRILTKRLTSVTVHRTKRGQDAAWLRHPLLTKRLISVTDLPKVPEWAVRPQPLSFGRLYTFVSLNFSDSAYLFNNTTVATYCMKSIVYLKVINNITSKITGSI